MPPRIQQIPPQGTSQGTPPPATIPNAPIPLPTAFGATPVPPSTAMIPISVWNLTGAWPKTQTFIFGQAGYLFVAMSVTMYTNNAAQVCGVPYAVDGVQSNRYATFYFNNASVHMTLPTILDVFGSPAGLNPSLDNQATLLFAGSHTFQISAATGTGATSDANDRAFVALFRIPANTLVQ